MLLLRRLAVACQASTSTQLLVSPAAAESGCLRSALAAARQQHAALSTRATQQQPGQQQPASVLSPLQQQQQLPTQRAGPCGVQPPPPPSWQQQQQQHRGLMTLAAPGRLWQHLQLQQHQQQPQPQQHQQQQSRGLLGVARPKNYQDHNQKRPPKYKIKTPPIARRRVVVGDDGVMWRMQAGRRHKRYKKSRGRLLALKGMVPLHRADAAKLRKLGFKKRWWYGIKA